MHADFATKIAASTGGRWDFDEYKIAFITPQETRFLADYDTLSDEKKDVILEVANMLRAGGSCEAVADHVFAKTGIRCFWQRACGLSL